MEDSRSFIHYPLYNHNTQHVLSFTFCIAVINTANVIHLVQFISPLSYSSLTTTQEAQLLQWRHALLHIIISVERRWLCFYQCPSVWLSPTLLRKVERSLIISFSPGNNWLHFGRAVGHNSDPGFLDSNHIIGRITRIAPPSVHLSVCPVRARNSKTKLEKAAQGNCCPVLKYRPTRLVVDAALRRIGKSRHGGYKIANISLNCQRI